MPLVPVTSGRGETSHQDERGETMSADVVTEYVEGAPVPQYDGRPAPGWAPRRVTPGCGHTVEVEGMASGYAVLPDDRTVCYPCADEHERETMRTADRLVAYVSSDGRRITTWSGGELARVTSTGNAVRRYTPTGGAYDVVHVDVRGADGSRWIGRGPGAGMYVRLRRLSSR